MVTQFNYNDMQSFGKWLILNEKVRREAIIKKLKEEDFDNEGVLEQDVQERMACITQADVENWKFWKEQKFKKTISRAKFVCSRVNESTGSRMVEFEAVTDGSPENEEFWKYTPSGSIQIGLSDECKTTFEEGAEYYVDFKKVKGSTGVLPYNFVFKLSGKNDTNLNYLISFFERRAKESAFVGRFQSNIDIMEEGKEYEVRVGWKYSLRASIVEVGTYPNGREDLFELDPSKFYSLVSKV